MITRIIEDPHQELALCTSSLGTASRMKVISGTPVTPVGLEPSRGADRVARVVAGAVRDDARVAASSSLMFEHDLLQVGADVGVC